MPEKEHVDLKWGTHQRMQLIEEKLYWTGELSRKNLVDEIKVSPAQASIDIASYRKLASENLNYDVTDKVYRVAESFKPRFISISPHSFLDGLIDDCAERIPYPFRQISPSLVRAIYVATKSGKWVTIDYTSMSHRGMSSRTIAPHQFLSDGLRWHVRAYDFHSGSFRDFVLGRISFAVITDPTADTNGHKWKPKHDHAWNNQITLTLMPHPDLTDSQRAAVEADYCMVNGQANLVLRQATLLYVVSRLRLIDESDDPVIQQVVLVNRVEVENMLNDSGEGR